MSVKHLRFLKKVLYKYKIISIKVGLFVEKKKKIARRNINNLRHADDTTLMQKVKRN